jgi:hypothetical protein
VATLRGGASFYMSCKAMPRSAASLGDMPVPYDALSRLITDVADYVRFLAAMITSVNVVADSIQDEVDGLKLRSRIALSLETRRQRSISSKADKGMP